MNILLLGAPGAGKGTQAELLAEHLHIPHVASGDLFREALRSDTPLGREAKGYIDRGELVPDAVTIAMVRERLAAPDSREGVILDGFPRTIEQARALDEVLAEQRQKVDLVAFIRVRPDELLKRLSGRWTCRDCGGVYHTLYNPPQRPGVCDACGGALYQRPDDRPETQSRRIEVYLAQTSPLVEHYRRRRVLVEIDGEQDIARVQDDLRKAVTGKQQAKA
ncbi:MAG TPA: adenylate kinase [Anaerolineae bacterium]|nr:adenylate kinase [Anaerolineae bacterium]HOR00964.1 adenylate kinase [Anaerolineae bacterium]HPL28714.1 adenylate kinase [Anaerolineae bacterium]